MLQTGFKGCAEGLECKVTLGLQYLIGEIFFLFVKIARVGFLFVGDALAELAELNPRQAQVIELRYLAGLTREQTAAILSVSPETVKLDSNFAKAWLKRKLRHAIKRHELL